MFWKILFIFGFVASIFAPAGAVAFAQPGSASPASAGSWTDPIFVPGTTFLHPDIDDAAGQVIAVDYSSGGSADNAKNLVISRRSSGVWGAASILASNAINSSSFFQDPPRDTFPVISGDGGTIAYLGHTPTGNTYDLYLIDKTGSVWGSPYTIPAVSHCIDNDMEISADGDTVTYSNCPAMFGTMRVYVVQRVSGVWQPPVMVSPSSSGGAQASISADGKKLVFQSGYQVEFTEQLPDGSWSVPLRLTNCYFSGSAYYVYLPKISPDGQVIFYWYYQLEATGSGNQVTGKDLYAMRRFGGTWGRPVKISGETVVPDLFTESRAAVNQTGTRVVFSRTLNGVPYTGSRLEVVEYNNGLWTAPVVLTPPWQAEYPALTQDGRMVVFDHSSNVNGGVASISTTGVPPGFSYTITSATVPAAGGVLTSTDGNTTATFANGSFAQAAAVSHTLVPGDALPGKSSFMDLGQGFDLRAVNAASSMPVQVDPAHPFSILSKYGSLHVAAIESTLKLYGWHADTCTWVPLGGVLDTSDKTIQSTPVDLLTVFAVMGDSWRQYLPLTLR